VVSFDTLGNNDTIKSKTTNHSNSNLKQNIKKLSNTNEDNINSPVQVKTIVSMEDKKNSKKINIMAMLKGQIKYEIVDVQKGI
jgi:hypothetical protein